MTAQDVFQQTLHNLIAPELRKLGFKKTTTQSFGYQDGEYGASLWTQKSVHSNKERVYFTVHLGAHYIPAGTMYWTRSLLGLIPGHDEPWWVVTAAGPAAPVASKLLREFRRYGWPAILAALDDPGFPPDPADHWDRTFPPVPRDADWYGGERQGPAGWLLQPTDSEHDDLFADIADANPLTRYTAMNLIADLAADDPRTIAALRDRVEHDPEPAVRRIAARGLGRLASDEEILQALRQAATGDEDLEVRWEARYAIRLFDDTGGAE